MPLPRIPSLFQPITAQEFLEYLGTSSLTAAPCPLLATPQPGRVSLNPLPPTTGPLASPYPTASASGNRLPAHSPCPLASASFSFQQREVPRLAVEHPRTRISPSKPAKCYSLSPLRCKRDWATKLYILLTSFQLDSIFLWAMKIQHNFIAPWNRTCTSSPLVHLHTPSLQVGLEQHHP